VNEYRGYRIVPKLDFGTGKGFLINGQWVKEGWIVTKDHANIMPGATWFLTVEEAQRGIDTLIAANGDAPTFWRMWYET
jgi:hypothetical protein